MNNLILGIIIGIGSIIILGYYINLAYKISEKKNLELYYPHIKQ